MTTSSMPMRQILLGNFSRWLRNLRRPSQNYIKSSRRIDLTSHHHCRDLCEQLIADASGVNKSPPRLPGRDACGAALLYQMLHAAKIGEDRIPPDTRRELEQGCGACNDKFRCAYELARDRAGETFGEFCTNADALRALQPQPRE